jgi:hypothetical protein
MTQAAIDTAEVRTLQSGFPFTTEFVKQLVIERKATSLFRFALAYARSFDEFPEDWTIDKREARRQEVIEAVKRQIAEAILETKKHCGQPLNVQSVFDSNTQRHGLIIQCSGCGSLSVIQEHGR